jgi:UPF0042 nucleotide-binding protein
MSSAGKTAQGAVSTAGPRTGGARKETPQFTPLVVIVTGMSGAGRTTVINALEDLGFEALNNFPLALIDRLIQPAEDTPRPIAIGVETRTRGFSTRALARTVDRLRRRQGTGALLVFLDCSDESLLARFSQTRRRHPLAPEEDPATGIARERDVLAEVRARADIVLDTSGMTPHALKAEIESRFSRQLTVDLAVSVQSFSYKRGAPQEADMVLDCRFLRNPYWQAELRTLDGRDARIQGFVQGDSLFGAFFEKLCEMLLMLLPAYKAEGKAYFCVAFGCTGGRHRSVTVSEMVAARLRAEGWPVALRHRELEMSHQSAGAGHGGGAEA